MSQKSYSSGSAFPELKKGTLRVYSSRICPYAERARLVLAHKNIPHEVININLKDKPEWFVAKTFGKVPVLQIDDDKIICESTAVSEYLDDAYPGDKLQTSDAYEKAQNRVLLEYFGQLSSAMYGFLRGAASEDVEEKMAQLSKHFQFYEDVLTKRGTTYFGGAKPGMIDFFMWPHLERVPGLAKLFPKVSLSGHPLLAAWWNAMATVPAIKKEMFDADWHFEVYQIIREGKNAGDYGLE